MQNKNLITVLIIIVIGAAAYFLFAGENAEAPTMNGTEATTEKSDFVGMTLVQAEVKATAENVPFRVVEIDGVMQPTTKDLQLGRINAVVEAGVITSYSIESMESTEEPQGSTAATSPTNPYFSNNEMVGEMVDVRTSPDETNQGTHDVIIGMTEAEANAYAAANEVDFRVGTIDGVGMPVTMDYRIGRITAEVTDGIVVGYSVEGEFESN